MRDDGCKPVADLCGFLDGSICFSEGLRIMLTIAMRKKESVRDKEKLALYSRSNN